MPNPFIKRRLIQTGFKAAGAPPAAAEAASFAAYGGKYAAFGVAVGAIEGLRELIKLQGESAESARRLALAEHDTGISFQAASGYADAFTAKLGTTRDASRELAAALADLQLHTGNVFKGADLAERLSTIVEARGLDAKEAAKLFQELGRGQAQAFERLTGRSPELVLDRYARSIGTVTSRLTDMERSQALTNAALQRSGEFAGIAAERFTSSAERIERFKNSAHDLAQDYGASFIDTYTSLSGLLYGVSFGQFGEPEAVRQLRESEKNSNSPGAIKKKQDAAQSAQQEQALLQQQQQSARALQDAFDKFSGERQVLLPAQQVERIRELQKLLESLKGSLSTDALDTFQKQLGGFTNELIGQIRQARESAISLLDSIGQRLHGDNPFIQLFSEGATAAERMRQQFGVLGDDAVQQLTKIEQAAVEQEKFAARIKTSLSAVRLEFQADQLERGYVGITAEQARQLGILQRQLDAAKSIVQSRREADAYARGFVYQNPFQIKREDFENYERIRKLRPQGTDEAARAGQKLIDDYTLEQTKNLPVTARNSPDAQTRALAADRAAALNAQADRLLASIQDEEARAEAGRAGVQLAQRELKELASLSQGGDRDTVRKEFLEITKALDPKELTGALKQGMINALKEEAQHQRQLEQDAKAFRDELTSPGGILYQIKEAIENQGGNTSSDAPTTARDAVTGEDEGKWQWTTRLKPGADPTKDESWTWDVRRVEALAAKSSAAVEAARDERQPVPTKPPANYFTNPNLYGYAPSQNQVSFSNMSSEDEKLRALVKAKAEGRYIGDPSSLFTSNLTHVGTPVEVNPYSQDFFRTRPGYDPRNDPTPYDRNDHSQKALMIMQELTGVMGGLVEQLKEHGLNINITVDDKGSVSTQVLGKAPRSDLRHDTHHEARRAGDVL